MEASAVRASATLTRPRPGLSGPVLRLRSDEQLVALFRDGNEEAFRVIHHRYHARLLAYARQMLPGSRQDAEDALQDVFVRAYRALRQSDREIVLRPWLYRVAHNRCIDALRRPHPAPEEFVDTGELTSDDPLAVAERREDLRRLVADIRRLPAPQRSALLMREMDGMPYTEIAAALEATVPAVKSLLVRARMGLASAAEARSTACTDIREQLTDARVRGVRASGQARRHLQDCGGCRAYKAELKLVEHRLAAFVPALGPLALAAKALGLGSAGSSASAGGATSAVAGSGASVGGGVAAGGGAVATTVTAAGSAVVAATATKVVAVAAVAVVAAGGMHHERHATTQHHRQGGTAAPASAPARASEPAMRHAPALRAHPAPAAHAPAAAPLRGLPAGSSAAITAPPPAVAPVVADPAPAAPATDDATPAPDPNTAPPASDAGSDSTGGSSEPVDPTTADPTASPSSSSTDAPTAGSASTDPTAQPAAP
jgi:RNA polymerase sigma factor (sigma-70 family)